VEIIIAIVIIYGLVKLIIWIVKKLIIAAPYIGKVIVFVLGVGAAAGLVVGVFFGIKNYIMSINDNISNKAFKVIMIFITSLFILSFVFLAINSSSEIVRGTRFGNMFSSRHKVTSTVVQEPQPFTNKIVKEDLNVREGPSANTAIKFVLRQNTVIKVYNNDKSGNWVRINYDGKEGYVNQNFLREAE